MSKDLFGNNAIKSDAAEEELKSYDANSFQERLKRLRIINSIVPLGRREFGSTESYKIFDEAIHCFIFGQYIAVLILAQAFVERRFQEYFNVRCDEKRAKYIMDKFIKELRGTGFLPDYVLDRIDTIRLKRNPFVHHRAPLQKDTLMARAFNSEANPDQLLYNDAKDAIEVMFHMVQHSIL